MSTSETPFDRAFKRFHAQLPSKEHKFLDLCQASPSVTYEEIQKTLSNKEWSQNSFVKGPLKRVVNALQDYNQVINQFVSAQPLPLALIWGALKIVVDSIGRCQNVLETMRDELDSMQITLQHLADIEELYPEAGRTQDLVVNSYMSIFKFWSRIHKECHRSTPRTIKRSLNSDSTRKLQKILAQLKQTMHDLDSQSTRDELRRQRAENAKAQEERDAAQFERATQSEWRTRQNSHNYLELCSQIRTHLRLGATTMDEATSTLHESNLQDKMDGTCIWMIKDDVYLSWKEQASPPVLCVRGPAGYGKSILTSFAVDEIGKDHAVAYYFCQRSEPCDSVLNLLRLFALQLFDAYFKQEYPVDQKLAHQIMVCHSVQQTKQVIEELVKALRPVFFIDALDELKEESLKHVSAVITFLHEQTSQGARIWFSQRSHTNSNECYDAQVKKQQHAILDIQDRTQTDVQFFLRSQFATLRDRLLEHNGGEFDEEGRVMMDLSEQCAQSKADGCFLWAKLVTRDFSEGEDALRDAKEVGQHITEYRPDELDYLYRSIFQQILARDRQFASTVISLIAFAKRHLRVDELRDAANMAITRGKRKELNSEHDRLPLATFLARYSALLQVDRSLDEGHGRCRFVHSTIVDFLEANPEVLQGGNEKVKGRELQRAGLETGSVQTCTISPEVIARACLAYLTRPIFSSLLHKGTATNEQGSTPWLDSSGTSMNTHHFAVYSAKYWVTHLERISPDDNLRRSVDRFIRSSNWATCIQMQCLWVDGQFESYTVGNIRVFPWWFISSGESDRGKRQITRFWTDHLFLLHDWQDFLTCLHCSPESRTCPGLAYRGEVDRIWWSSLRLADTFMKDFKSRYYSFSLEKESPSPMLRGNRYEAVCVVDTGILILRLVERNTASHTLDFKCEHWALDSSLASISLLYAQSISTTEKETQWPLYTSKHLKSTVSIVSRATQFSTDGKFFRIGSQVFAFDGKEYTPLTGGIPPRYVEDFAARSNLVVFGTRAKSRVETSLGSVAPAEGSDSYEGIAWLGLDPPDCSDESDSESESDWNECAGVEYWSDASTELNFEEVLDSDGWSDMEAEDDKNSSGDEASISKSRDSSCHDENVSDDDNETSQTADSNSTSSSSTSSRSPSPISWVYPDDSDDEEADWAQQINIELPARRVKSSKKKSFSQSDEIELTILDYSHTPPLPRFFFKRPLSYMLYASPPAVHPTAPLAVYPLDLGDIMFIDFEEKTWYMRKLRPFHLNSRQISVQPRFSPCGKFLHVATIEARAPDNIKSKSKDSEEAPKLDLTVFIATYRLSSTKTSYALPLLIHRAKVEVGTHIVITLSRLPVTFTWRSEEVYVMQRETKLLVSKVSLFPGQNADVQVPSEQVFLPMSALDREIFFHPGSLTTGQPALVFMGSEIPTMNDLGLAGVAPNEGETEITLVSNLCLSTRAGKNALRGMVAPPVGCALTEKDMGQWVKDGEARPRTGRRGVGHLDLKREKFDSVDDCNVETFGL